jgi:hypothetical protein
MGSSHIAAAFYVRIKRVDWTMRRGPDDLRSSEKLNARDENDQCD